MERRRRAAVSAAPAHPQAHYGASRRRGPLLAGHHDPVVFERIVDRAKLQLVACQAPGVAELLAPAPLNKEAALVGERDLVALYRVSPLNDVNTLIHQAIPPILLH